MLVIVARDQQPLFEYMRWGFSKVREVQVVLDRRLGSRRERAQPAATSPERRASDRRRERSVRAELAARGFVLTSQPVLRG